MKKEFKAEMTVVRFGAEDVIATSGRSVGLTNFNDGISDNNTFNIGGTGYTFSDNAGYNSFRRALSSYFGDDGLKSQTSGDIYFGDNSVTNIYKGDHAGIDGDYTYNGVGTYRFSKKQ